MPVAQYPRSTNVRVVATPGLRERKKAATRKLIIQVADELFIERGFEDVTLDEVADRCEVSVRTVLRYFPTKEELGLAREHEALEDFRDGLERRTGDVLGYWRYWAGQMIAGLLADVDWHRRRFAMIRQGPLYMNFIAVQREFQHLLASALADERPDADPLAPQLLAALLAAGNEAIISDWLSGSRQLDPAELLEVIDYATELFASRLASPGEVKPAKRARRVADRAS